MLQLLSEKPGATKRDLAKALGLKGSDRIHLKRVLKELEAEGAVARRRKTLHKAGALPTMVLVDSSGKVINRNIRTAAELDRQLEKLFGDKTAGVAVKPPE